MSDSNSDDSDAPSPLLPAELLARLRGLAQQPAPQDLAPGAMCYSVAAPPKREKYTCTVCGKQTLYSTTSWCAKIWDVRDAERAAEDLDGHGVILDATSFCDHCSPDAEQRRLALVVRYADGSKRRAEDVSTHDVQLVRDFFAGEGKHAGDRGEEEPLKKHLSQLAKLLLPPELHEQHRAELRSEGKLMGAISKIFSERDE